MHFLTYNVFFQHSEADEIKPKARDGSMGEYSDEESDDAGNVSGVYPQDMGPIGG